MTVKELLTEFDESYISSRLKPTTQDGYRTNIYKHIIPSIGDFEISEVDYCTVDKLCLDLRAKGLNNTSIIYVLSVLRRAFNRAIQRGDTSNTVMQLYDFPRRVRYQINVLSGKQLAKLNSPAARRSLVYLPVMLASRYGLRRGEIMGLKASDFDFSAGTLTVSRSAVYIGSEFTVTDCKSAFSRRIIKLDPDDCRYISCFIGHQLQLSLVTADGFIYSFDGRQVVQQHVIDREFKKLLKQLELPKIRFHDLRHSYATYMLKAGVNPKTVSSVLGHSSVSVTLDIYTHFDLSAQDACLSVLAHQKDEELKCDG